MMINNERAGFTKTGFSRSFGCCSRFELCQMGKGQCFYETIDPEVRDGCAAYRREHLQVQVNVPLKDEPQKELTEKDEEYTQLSLFDFE